MQEQPKAEADTGRAYADKTGNYFGGVRQDFLARLPARSDLAILEIGCGYGETGAAAIVQGKCASYVGVELFPKAADVARTHLTEVVTGDVERIDLPWPPDHFDALLMSEVLEHLVDPWATVRHLVPLLKPGALVMASSPNVAQIRTIRNLLADRWELADSGLMDRTHLRWFTQSSYRQMFEQAGVTIDHVAPLSPPGRWGRLFNTATWNRYSHLTMQQICVVGHKR